MGHFCIGSYTRALLSGAQKGETQATFCPRLFALLDPHVKNSVSFDDTMGQILGGAQNLNPDWIRTARDINPLKAERYFYQFVTPYLEPQKNCQMLLVLKEIIDADSMKSDMIGCLNADSLDIDLQDLFINGRWRHHRNGFSVHLLQIRILNWRGRNRRFYLDLDDLRSERLIHYSLGYMCSFFKHASFLETFNPGGISIRNDTFSSAPFRDC